MQSPLAYELGAALEDEGGQEEKERKKKLTRLMFQELKHDVEKKKRDIKM